MEFILLLEVYNLKSKAEKEFEISTADVLRYYIAWKDTDEELITCIKKDDLENFNRFLINMNIKRNFKKGSTKKIFSKTKEYLNKKPEISDVEVFSDVLFKAKLLAGKNKNAIVAASKILWMINKEEIIIEDSRAKKSLKNLTGKKIPDYSKYCIYWEEQYQFFKTGYLKKIKETKIEMFDAVFKEEWFIRRTFDNYLWSRGKSKTKSN